MSKLESTEENVALTAKGLQSIRNFASKIEKENEAPVDGDSDTKRDTTEMCTSTAEDAESSR